MIQLPSLADLARFAAAPTQAPAGWLPLSDPIPPLGPVIERFQVSDGICHTLFRISGPQPNALILRQIKDGMGEASYLVTDRNIAWDWPDDQNLGAETDDSVSDIYQCSTWATPQYGITEVSVHEFESEDGSEVWAMLQCICPIDPGGVV